MLQLLNSKIRRLELSKFYTMIVESITDYSIQKLELRITLKDSVFKIKNLQISRTRALYIAIYKSYNLC